MDSRYWRKEPIKKFNVDQTMYSLVMEENKKNLDLKATGFMGNSMTYKELFESVDYLANSFHEIGINDGDSVAILTISMPLVQQCILSLSKIGAKMTWIDLRAKEKDLINYINSSKCKAIVVFEDILPLVEKIIDKVDVNHVIVCSPKDYLKVVTKNLAKIKDKKDGKKIIIPKDNRFVKMSDFINEGKHLNAVSTANYQPEKPSLTVQSSGSTGKPKQIVHTERNFNSEIQKMAYLDLPLYRGNTLFIAVPPFIIYGLANSFYSSLVFSMKGEMSPFIEKDIVCNALGHFDVSFAVPLHYRYINERIKQLRLEIDVLRKQNDKKSKILLIAKLRELKKIIAGIEKTEVFVSGGDKISFEELIEMQHRFNKVIVNGYGNNECMGATIVSPRFANRPGSIGIPMHGVDIKIINAETGEEVKEGEIGELLISSDNLFVEYLNNEEETNNIKIFDGKKYWVKSGDLCLTDPDGFIYPKGRNKRLIKKDAFKIAPDTIEDVIIGLPYVKDCVVVGVDDKEFISVPMAFIQLDNNVELNDVYDEILAVCTEELPDYEVPTYFEQIDEIPYTPNDKHDFGKLEELGNQIVKERTKGKKLKKTINNS